MDLFKKLVMLAEEIGTVDSVRAYRGGLVSVEGTDKDGKPFTLSYRPEQELINATISGNP